jgi:hypothetical protein
MTLRGLLAALVLYVVAALSGATDQVITPDQALEHVGKSGTVCGVVASAKFASQVRGSPTFLNLGAPYPNHVFTALIWGENRDRFAYPLETLRGQFLCVSGLIEVYRGRAQIEIAVPSQMSRRP